MIATLLRRCGTLVWLLPLAVALTPGTAPGQVSYDVVLEEHGGHYVGTALVQAPRRADVTVEVWESREEPEVRLTDPAEATVWPDSFRLAAGERQTVRLRVPRDAYPAGTLLRLETVVAPAPVAEEGATSDGDSSRAVRTRIRFQTRVLSKVRLPGS